MSQNCICKYEVRPLGSLHGVRMGHDWVRVSTAKGCPEHDACHGWTAARRAERPSWSRPYCPIHGTRDCPGGVR